MKTLVTLIQIFLSFTFSFAQESVTIPSNWFNLDRNENKVMGVSTEKVYEKLLANKTSSNVIVAVIDNGVDIHHEDLVGKIWVNEKEIPDTKIKPIGTA